MTINLGKLLSIFGKVAAALPTIVEAITPIIHEVKGKPAASGPVAEPKDVPEVSSPGG